MTVALIGSPTRTNAGLASRWRELRVDARVLWADEAMELLGPTDTAIVRLDVLPTLDGVEPGLGLLPDLEARGVRVLNRATALLGAHDKLRTVGLLAQAGLPHPETIHVARGSRRPLDAGPCVLKPRFGSWGQDVFLCRTSEDVSRVLAEIADRPWWRKQGALLQELVEPAGYDVRVVVAGQKAVAGAVRTAAEGEWRTNVTLGATLARSGLPPGTERIAVRAAQAIGVDFAGVDLLPVGDGWTVLELNGAVDFNSRYALPGIDPYGAVLDELGIETGEPAADRAKAALGLVRDCVATTAARVGDPARVGDEIVVAGRWLGEPRSAVVVDVLGDRERLRFRVRWEDGHESIFFPGEGATVRRRADRTRSQAV